MSNNSGIPNVDSWAGLNSPAGLHDRSDLSGGLRHIAPSRRPSVEQELFESGAEFDFFQAVSVLEAIYPDRRPLSSDGLRRKQPLVHFVADSASTSFAASAIHEVLAATGEQPVPRMVVGFMGLTGPSGVLPTLYTDLLRRIELEGRGPQKYALRDWFDLFNHRLVTLFYRAWKKYRPYATYRDALRGSTTAFEDDSITQVLRSVCGFGLPAQATQLSKLVQAPVLTSHAPLTQTLAQTSTQPLTPTSTQTPTQPAIHPQTARSALLRYAGCLAQRPRSASNLAAILTEFFDLPIQVEEFRGNWLTIDQEAQSQLGVANGNCVLGETAVVGEQAWERQNRIIIRVGPISHPEFTRFLPDHTPAQATPPTATATESTRHAVERLKNDFEQLSEIVRLFIGAEFDFDVQLVLEASEVPPCQLAEAPTDGLRLGWNAWLPATTPSSLLDDTLLTEQA